MVQAKSRYCAADIALYCAKDEKPKSASRFFDADMDARTQERDLIERDLPSAIIKGDVRSYYQPLFDLQTKHVVGFEALARWQHPTLGEVSPERFIPVAESCGLMTELTDLCCVRPRATHPDGRIA